MKTPAQFRRDQTGFSITELMVAMTIGLIILAAVATMFVNTNKASNNQNRLARVQENGRFAMYYLLRDLRMTGYMGCQNDLTDHLSNDLATTTGFYFGTTNLSTPIEGIDDVTSGSTPAWAPSGSTALPASVWSGTAAAIAKPDLITIRRVDTASVQQLTTPMAGLSDKLTINNTSGFQKNPVILVADCTKADLVQVMNATSSQLDLFGASCPVGVSPCNAATQMSKQYDTAAAVYPYTTRTYYIGLNNNGVPSLYRDDNGGSASGGTTVELVEGVESMKILYGVATPPNIQPSYYRKASAMSATDWKNVVSIKFGILARTPNSKDTDIDNTAYDVNGTVIGPFNDRNSRRVFTATALLKDRILP